MRALALAAALVLGAVTAEAGGLAGGAESLALWQRLLSWVQTWVPEEAPAMVNSVGEEGSSIDPNGGTSSSGKSQSSTPPLDGVVLK
jgi:hypothetical protein